MAGRKVWGEHHRLREILESLQSGDSQPWLHFNLAKLISFSSPSHIPCFTLSTFHLSLVQPRRLDPSGPSAWTIPSPDSHTAEPRFRVPDLNFMCSKDFPSKLASLWYTHCLNHWAHHQLMTVYLLIVFLFSSFIYFFVYLFIWRQGLTM
jgi:hypothetical protein